MASSNKAESSLGANPTRSGQETRPYRCSVPATDYTTSWCCNWTRPSSGILTEHDLDLLRHVNCSYLSSDKPPTLLALKQHAQSLAILIRKLCISTTFGIPNRDNRAQADKEGSSRLRFKENEAFDWLNNLDVPYTTEDRGHHMPLYYIRNDVLGESDVSGPTYHCPLVSEQDQNGTQSGNHAAPQKRMPRMTHHALMRHANECLEILDHEFSATGGLLGVLPTTAAEDKDEMAGARNTLLGQWLLHHQHLVARMHELEIGYANALDALAGEAVVPGQLLSKASFEARSGGKQVSFPQDRYVLVNAGDDVTRQIHELLDERENEMEDREWKHRGRGVSGDRMWEKPQDGQGDDIARGLVAVDVMSRFYRVKGRGHDSPIFLLPAVEEHDGTVQTREMERNPTVVSVLTPRWPLRVSEWEKKYRGRLDRASEIEVEHHKLTMERDGLRKKLEEKEKALAERARDSASEMEE
ncbi:hypothetical protein ACRE_062440 [Hapsidospora chrysogenum ATCC 11550]|uniref:Uncharacterized protein n=1 Tax=Hapsidospora chrysogenum (strain ATCC 11550 / CBS 779.69 / DSM 880 / IAM 14645 / JCM 23072 / IMI 49137) TaxID=857340 RepID=A0A086T0Y4_HAPC1|nr:hypothetical protein ACRE_062440 [Hapsidospora chrysogenum ATCC 11550]